MARGQVLLQKERSKLDADGIGIILASVRESAAMASGLTLTVLKVSVRRDKQRFLLCRAAESSPDAKSRLTLFIHPDTRSC